MKIEKISWNETIAIRHQVLWPNKEPLYCKVSGDESAIHFGVLKNNIRVCVASLYISDDAARLRKFATLSEHQGHGVGTFMLEHIIKELKQSTCNYFWCDARISATTFYKKFGFKPEGHSFKKGNIEYIKLYMYL